MKAEAMSLTFLGNEALIKIPFFSKRLCLEQK